MYDNSARMWQTAIQANSGKCAEGAAAQAVQVQWCAGVEVHRDIQPMQNERQRGRTQAETPQAWERQSAMPSRPSTGIISPEKAVRLLWLKRMPAGPAGSEGARQRRGWHSVGMMKEPDMAEYDP